MRQPKRSSSLLKGVRPSMKKRALRVGGGQSDRARAAQAPSAIARFGCSHASSPQPGQGNLLARLPQHQTNSKYSANSLHLQISFVFAGHEIGRLLG